MSKVSIEQATKEFEKWLKFKKVGEMKREKYKEQEESIIDAICEGQVTIDEKCNLTFIPEPIVYDDAEDGVALDKIVFAPRLRQFEVNKCMKGVKPTDGDGRLAAYIQASTGVSKAMINKLYSEEITVCQNIASYFL